MDSCGCGVTWQARGLQRQPTDRQAAHKASDESDRELFEKDRARFNVKQRQVYERQNKGKVKAEPVESNKDREVKEAIKEFNDARAAEKAATTGKGEPGETE